MANRTHKSPQIVIHPAEIVAEMSFDALKGVKVAFINMPLRESALPNTPPQGPALLAARLRKYGAEPTIIDLNAYRINNAAADMGENRPNGRLLTHNEASALIAAHFDKHGTPDIIGFSGMITTLRWQEAMLPVCREAAPDAMLLSGGGLATELRAGLFQWMPELDAIAHSEGDDIILVIAWLVGRARAAGARQWRGHSAFAPYHHGELGGRDRFVFGGDRPKNLDDLPFAAWDLLEEDVLGEPILEKYIGVPVWGMAANNSSATPFSMQRSLTTVSSRGCPYKCAFCYRGAQGERIYGMRSAEDLAAEAEWLKRSYDIDFLGFPDDNFAVDKRRIVKLPGALQGLGLRWGTHTRLDEADERLDDMAKSGCVYIGFGAESAAERVLHKMDKGGFILRRGLTRLEGSGDYEFPVTMVDGIRNCRDSGIHANCTWILGYPDEDLEDLKTSVAFILWQRRLYTENLNAGTADYEAALQSVNAKMFTATAYPGTAMFREPVVRQKLAENFSIQFAENGQPIYNAAFRNYVLELDDATKILLNLDGEPLYYGAMTMNQFLEARQFVEEDRLEDILEM